MVPNLTNKHKYDILHFVLAKMSIKSTMFAQMRLIWEHTIISDIPTKNIASVKRLRSLFINYAYTSAWFVRMQSGALKEVPRKINGCTRFAYVSN